MINNLTEQDIMDYLMTSEFEEGLTPEEFKLLLFKFRNFYRVLNGKSDLLKTELEGKIREMKEVKSSHSRQLTTLMMEKASIEDQCNSLKNRPLSWRERWTGKIITEENEIK
jgi:hypothetical protein